MPISSENLVVETLPAAQGDHPELSDNFGENSQVVAILQAPSPQAVLPLAKEDVSGFSVEELLVRADQALGASQLLRRLSGEQYWLACQAWAIARDKAVHGTWNQIIESRGLKASTVRQAVQVYRALPDIEMVRGLTITQIKEKGGLVRPKPVAERPAAEVGKISEAGKEFGDSGSGRPPQQGAEFSEVVRASEPARLAGVVQPGKPSTPPTSPKPKEMLAEVVRALEEVGHDCVLDAEALDLVDRASTLLQALREAVARRDAA